MISMLLEQGSQQLVLFLGEFGSIHIRTQIMVPTFTALFRSSSGYLLSNIFPSNEAFLHESLQYIVLDVAPFPFLDAGTSAFQPSLTTLHYETKYCISYLSLCDHALITSQIHPSL